MLVAAFRRFSRCRLQALQFVTVSATGAVCRRFPPRSTLGVAADLVGPVTLAITPLAEVYVSSKPQPQSIFHLYYNLK